MSRLPLTLVFAIACSGSDAPDGGPDGSDDIDVADTDIDTDADADTDADSDADTDTGDTGDSRTLPDGPGAGGVLIDADGLPIAGAMVLGCTEVTCIYATSEADGWFWFDTDPDWQMAIKTKEDLALAPRRGAALEPCVIIGQTAIDIGELYAPSLPDGQPWASEAADPQVFDAGDGLTLQMNRADVTLAILESFDDVAAARIPEDYVPTYPDLPAGETLVGVWAVHPFAAYSSSPVAVAVESTLPAGTVVHFRYVDSLGGELSPPAVGESDGTVARTDPGEGLYELSYVVVSTP